MADTHPKAEARRLGRTYYMSTKGCKYGHPPGLRTVSNGNCMLCDRIKARKRWLAIRGNRPFRKLVKSAGMLEWL